MSDFQIQVGGDFGELLRGFQQLESRAQQSGQNVGKGLADGIQGYSSKSIAALQAELTRLEQRQIKVAVDSTAFEKTGKKITEIKALIAEVEKRRLTLNVDDRSITALQTKLAQLQSKQTKLDVDSSEFIDAQKEINKLEAELNDISRKKLLIDADANSALAVTAKLQGELDKLRNKQLKIDVDSAEFAEVSREIDRVEGELSALEKKKLLINADPSSIIALRSKLNDLQDELDRVQIGSKRFKELQAEIRKTESELNEAGQSANAFQDAIDKIGPAIAAIGAGAALVDFARNAFEAAKAAESAQVRVKALSQQYGETDKALKLIAKSAKLLNLSTTEASDGFLQLYGALRPVGISLEDIGTVFTATNAAAKNFGLSAGSVQAAVLQLSQGLAAGALQGDELRSIMEQMPPIAQAIAKEMGVTVGQVKKLGSEGKITAEIVIAAIKGMNDVELGKLNTTLNTTQERINAQQVAWNQLAVTVGTVFVEASLPFIEAATAVAKSLTGIAEYLIGLPAPIKAVVTTLGTLTVGVSAAIAGMVAFQAALASTQVQSTIAAVKALGAAILTNLAGASTVAIVAVDTLYKAIKGFNIQSFFAGIGQLGTALKTQLAGAATVAATAFAELGKAIKSGAFANALKSIAGEIAAFAGGVLRLAAVIAPLAIAFGIVSKGMEGASQASERYKAANDEISKALVKLRGELDQTNVKIADSRNVFQQLFDSFSEGAAVMGDINTTNALIQTLTALNSEAKAYLATLGETGTLTDQQIAKANAYVVAIQSTSGAVQELIERFEEQAKKAELIGDQKQAEVYRNNAAALKEYADRVGETGAQLANKTRITAQDIVSTGQATQATKELADAQRQLNEVLATEPIRNLEAQLTVGNQLVSLSQALSAQEQSRFGIVKAGLEYELSKAQERKASESEIGRIKSQIQEVESNALRARYAALQQEQALQVQMLALSQQKARLESDLSIQQQELKVLEAAVKLQEAINSGKKSEIDQSRAVLDLQTAVLGTKYEGKAILEAVQPLERNILAVQQATTSNSLKEQAARLGIKDTLQASARPASNIANYSSEIATESKRAADQYANVAVETARGSKATNEAAKNTKTLAAGAKDAAKSTGDTAKAAGTASKGLAGSAKAAGGLKKELTDATKAAGGTSQNTGAIGNSAKQADQQMKNLGSTFQATQKTAAAAAQLAAQFSKTAGSVGGIAKAMVQAAAAAKAFYNTLLQASGLPGSRWTGGPVAAGQTVRINDGPAGRSLGQESFLSAAGRLSLINKPANALWTPPTSGVVIPAAVTDTLKARGVFDAGRAARAAITNKPAPRVASTDSQLAATVARQAVAIGKLEQAVNRLTDKDWNVHLKVRNTDNGASYLNTLNRML